MNVTVLLRKAALNNIAWCESLALAHQCPSEFIGGLWCSSVPLPSPCPNIITAVPHALNAHSINEAMANVPFRWSIKDSFNEFDERKNNYQLLYTSFWYGYKAPQQSKQSIQCYDYLELSTVNNDQDFDAWMRAWALTLNVGNTLHKNLLKDQSVQFVYLEECGQISCGAALHHSHEVIGISHLFGSREEQQRLIKTLQLTFPEADIVGYGDEAELTMLKPFGFSELGKLNFLQAEPIANQAAEAPVIQPYEVETEQ